MAGRVPWTAVPRYCFSDFILSPRRRMLTERGHERPLIPRYFDLLVFLVERRHEAVHRRDIFDRVWSDVVVSDSALSQAIRTIRRTLGDDSREPRFIRTVSRHGYRFVFPDVVEEDDRDQPIGDTLAAPIHADPPAAAPAADPFEPLLQRLTGRADSVSDEEDQREAAELLHSLDVTEALQRLGTRPGHVFARALLRDTRWETADAGRVPILGQPAPIATAAAIVRLRLRQAARIAAVRWASASAGGAMAGLIGGVVGGLLLVVAPNSTAPLAVAAVLALVGGICGAAGGAGVGAGLSLAEAVSRSQRAVALVCGAAAGGGLVGSLVQWLGRWSLEELVGVQVATGGGLEGLVIGAAAGLGYAGATARPDVGLAAPRGRRRLKAAILVAASCGLGALAVTLLGRPLVGGTIHAIAQASHGSRATLSPLGALIGEPGFGPITQALIGTGEGALFGLGLALGLTRRPVSSPSSHQTLMSG
jgi:DNA-binding winged helix-turn-helix (wHTH) protein